MKKFSATTLIQSCALALALPAAHAQAANVSPYMQAIQQHAAKVKELKETSSAFSDWYILGTGPGGDSACINTQGPSVGPSTVNPAAARRAAKAGHFYESYGRYKGFTIRFGQVPDTHKDYTLVQLHFSRNDVVYVSGKTSCNIWASAENWSAKRAAAKKALQCEENYQCRAKKAEELKKELAAQAAKRASEIQKKLGMLINTIKTQVSERWVPVNAGALSCETQIRLGDDGQLLGTPIVVRSSGDAHFNHLVVAAIEAAAPFVPPHGLPYSAFNQPINLTMNAEDLNHG